MDNEFKINNNISFEDEETKIEYQKYLDEVNEYNRKVANGERTEKDLSTITSEFKDKFLINGNEGESKISIKCPKCGNLIQENFKDVPSNIMKLDTICSNCGTNIMFKNLNYKD